MALSPGDRSAAAAGRRRPRAVGHRAGIRDINARLAELVPARSYRQWSERFRSAVDAVSGAVLTLEPLAAERWQGLEFYRKVKPAACWVPPFIPLVEIAETCFLPPAVAHDPDLARFEALGCLLFGLFNDVVSLAADDTGSPVCNAVLMHRAERSGSTRQSITRSGSCSPSGPTRPAACGG